MKKIAIVHFSPVERYPPAVNWLNYIGSQAPYQWDVRVYSTRPDVKVHQYFKPSKKFIRLCRFGVVSKEQRAIERYWNYVLFYTRTLANMIRWRPDIVMYYESLSALPALLYARFINRRAKVLVHYHEYISEQEYREGIPMNKWPHMLERKWYPKFCWISHTNEDRMRMFLEENSNIRQEQTHILPNYPPRSWAGETPMTTVNPLRIVYVGAVDLTSMYTMEFASWIAGLDGFAKWDIYSSNITDEARRYLSGLSSGHINFMGSVEYDALPEILRRYNVGVVLYRGTTLNYKFNAPNKLYEYWACGLDVWFPEEMESCRALAAKETFPGVLAIDFQRLAQIDISRMMSRQGKRYVPSPFYAEDVLEKLLNKINLHFSK